MGICYLTAPLNPPIKVIIRFLAIAINGLTKTNCMGLLQWRPFLFM